MYARQQEVRCERRRLAALTWRRQQRELAQEEAILLRNSQADADPDPDELLPLLDADTSKWKPMTARDWERGRLSPADLTRFTDDDLKRLE